MASDDEEYVPSDLDEEAFIAQAYGTDEEAYLAGATTGAALLALEKAALGSQAKALLAASAASLWQMEGRRQGQAPVGRRCPIRPFEPTSDLLNPPQSCLHHCCS